MYRTGLAAVLVVLGCLLAGPAVAAYVIVDEVTDQESYLDAVTPLAADPAVQAAVADQLSAAVNEKAPPAAQQLIDTSVRNFVASEDFRAAWVELNKTVHPQLLALLRDEGGAAAIEGDALVLDLGVLSADMKARFAAEGVPLADQLPDIDAQVEVVSGPAIRQAVPAFELLETLSIALPLAALVLIALGLVLSARRGRTLVVTGVGLIVMMLLVVLLQWLVRDEVTERSPQPELTGPFYDAITDPVAVTAWIICAIGAVCVIVGIILARRRRPERTARPADHYPPGQYPPDQHNDWRAYQR